MKQKPLKLLLIEDSEDDAFFLMRTLKKGGFNVEYERIETLEALISSLAIPDWDLVITDHTLPELNSIDVINTLNKLNQNLPLIVLSGTIDQSIAIESMRLGARDFIMKDDTARLIPAIDRELKEAKNRQKIKQSESRYKRDLHGIMYHSPAIIAIKDLQGKYTYINQKGEEALASNNQPVLGKTDFDIFSQEDAQKLHRNDQCVLASKQAIEVEEVVLFNNDVFVFSSIKYPLFDDKGEIYAICSISTDITEKKQHAEKLRRSQKMEAIGQLTGGIAHDFNNQLGIVTGYLEFLSEALSSDEKLNKWLNITTRASMRCIDLTRQLLSFSRLSSEEKSVINVNAAIDEFSDMIKRSVTPQVQVEISLADDLWNVEADVGELQDVILNLVINARDAMPSGGELNIITKNILLDEVSKQQIPAVESNEFVQIIVSDTGTGMDAQTLERIFEPFYTTKPVGQGTGLGLSMVYGFTQRNHGDLSVYSEPRIGTTFRLSLPRVKTQEDALVLTKSTLDAPEGNETILIVDDETELANLAVLHLSSLGYDALKANGPTEALSILSSNQSVDLLFTDVVMPGGMNGYELVKAALALRPELKIQITSGFISETIEGHGLSYYNADLLSKPYSKVELACSIRKSLDH